MAMSLQAITVSAPDSPVLFWAWAGAAVVLATLLGFVAGVSYASRSPERGIRRATRQLSTLFALVLESLEKAQRVAGLLESLPQFRLSAEQVDTLESKRGSLLDSLGRIVRRHEPPTIVAEVKPKPPQPIKLAWQHAPLDAATGLPERSAFDANLRLMLEAGTQSSFSSALLLVKIDRLEQLRSRFGIQGCDVFGKSLAAVVQRAVREQDLVCRLSLDTFAVLVPSVDAEAGRKLSQAIRNCVRFHTFRLQDVGPEVLVTASFGQAFCAPGDKAEFALHQAGDALAQSVRRGRNQLHVFDGQSLVYCAAG